ncbi:DUF554 domain-containing protein [Enterococcus hirae]|nr:DUF554 domain-containing protein [Enterococcus hirae]
MQYIFINGLSVVIGSIVGAMFGKKFSENYKELLNSVIGLSAIVVGFTSITKGVATSSYKIVFIMMLILGATIGQMMNLDKGLDDFLQRFHSFGQKSEGLVLGISLLCIGTLPILGPLQSALQGDSSFILVNIIFSFIVAVTLASNYGIILIFVAPLLVLIELGVYVSALPIDTFITPSIFNEMELVGGILALTSGLNILKITQIPVLNLLPALFAPFLLAFFN